MISSIIPREQLINDNILSGQTQSFKYSPGESKSFSNIFKELSNINMDVNIPISIFNIDTKSFIEKFNPYLNRETELQKYLSLFFPEDIYNIICIYAVDISTESYIQITKERTSRLYSIYREYINTHTDQKETRLLHKISTCKCKTKNSIGFIILNMSTMGSSVYYWNDGECHKCHPYRYCEQIHKLCQQTYICRLCTEIQCIHNMLIPIFPSGVSVDPIYCLKCSQIARLLTKRVCV